MQKGKVFPDSIPLRITVKAWDIKNSLTGFIVLSFCGLYFSVVLIILSCTILAFEQLSSLEYNRHRYEILDKIGVSKETQYSLIRKEIAIFFFIPAIFPLIVITLLIIGIQQMFHFYFMQENLIPLYGIITFLLFGIIYFLAVYSIFRRAVLLQK